MKKYWGWMNWTVLVAGIAIFGYLTIARRPVEQPVRLTAAVTTNPDSTLVLLAQREGFFQDEGLALTILPFTSGKDALEAVLQGNAHLATVAETPITLQVLRGAPISVIAQIFSSDQNMGVIGRRDKGIVSPGDLRKKRVGTPFGTNAQYFLHAFLAVEGVEESEVTIVNTPPEGTVEALLSGSVDAVAIWQPFLFTLQKQLDNEAVSFSGAHAYTYTFNVAAQKTFVEANPQVVQTFLRALLKAETMIREQPARARAEVADMTHWDHAVFDAIWDNFNFRVGLDQTLLISMETQARWAITTGQAPPQDLPNFLNVIDMDGLRSVAPLRVTITP